MRGMLTSYFHSLRTRIDPYFFSHKVMWYLPAFFLSLSLFSLSFILSPVRTVSQITLKYPKGMTFYQIARYFNLGVFVAVLLSDIVVSMVHTQDDQFLALFYSDYLAIVLIAAYAVSDLSEIAHIFLSLYTFVASCWFILWAVRILYDVVVHRATFSIVWEFSSACVVIRTTQTKTVEINGEPSTLYYEGLMDPFFRSVLRRLNFGFGLALVVKAIMVLAQRIETSPQD